MGTRRFALIIGIAFLVAGILGFVPGVTIMHADHPELSADASFGYLLGIFPVNWLHDLVHLGVGIWGLFAASTVLRAKSFSRGLAIIYGVLAVLGIFPATNMLFGLVPLYGHDIWLHAGTALVAGYFGYVHHDAPEVTEEGYAGKLATDRI